jgi:hypothetical protein
MLAMERAEHGQPQAHSRVRGTGIYVWSSRNQARQLSFCKDRMLQGINGIENTLIHQQAFQSGWAATKRQKKFT